MLEALIQSGMDPKGSEYEDFIASLKADPAIDEVYRVTHMRRGPGLIMDGSARLIYDLLVVFEAEEVSDLTLPSYSILLKSFGVEQYEIFGITTT